MAVLGSSVAGKRNMLRNAVTLLRACYGARPRGSAGLGGLTVSNWVAPTLLSRVV